MKKLFSIIAVVINLIASAQNVNIPSTTLLNVLTGTVFVAKNASGNNILIDTNNDGFIQVSETLPVWELIINNRGLTDLTGIESFTNLRKFYCSQNAIINMPFTSLINLKILDVGQCNLNALDVSNIPSLEFLWCPYNQISTLDLSNNPNLNKLICFNNNMTSLNLKNGIDQNLEYGNNIVWNGGNPGLTFICADASEVQGMLNYCVMYNTPNGVPIPMIDSDCSLVTASFEKNEVSVYPNPSGKLFNFNFEYELKNEVTITLYNLFGQILLTNKIINTDEYILDSSNFAQGQYIVKVTNGEQTDSYKIIKN